MKLTGNYVLRFMAGEYVLVPQGELLLNGKEPLMIDEMTRDFLKAIEDGADTTEKITDRLIETYDASFDIIFSTVQNLLKEFTELMVIEQ